MILQRDTPAQRIKPFRKKIISNGFWIIINVQLSFKKYRPMKNLFFTVAGFLLLCCFSQKASGQKVKDYVLEVSYQAVPPYPFYNKERILYTYLVKENYIDPGNNVATWEITYVDVESRTMFYKSIMPGFGAFLPVRSKVDGSFHADVEIGLSSLQNKNIKPISRAGATPADPAVSALGMELTYNLPFSAIMKDSKDSVIFNEPELFSKPMTFVFPDDFQTMIPNYRNYVSKPAVEALYMQHAIAIEKEVKDRMIKSNLEQFNKILNKRHDEVTGSLRFPFYYLKDRKLEYPAFDSALAIMKIVCDSIKANRKAKNYKNWHTAFVKEQTKKVDAIIGRLSNEYIAKHSKNEIDAELGEEIIFGLLKNRHAVYMLQNRYDEALKEIEDFLAKGKFHKELSQFYLENMQDYFKEEKRRYENNKKHYGWE
jgi:hypothetical protein